MCCNKGRWRWHLLVARSRWVFFLQLTHRTAGEHVLDAWREKGLQCIEPVGNEDTTQTSASKSGVGANVRNLHDRLEVLVAPQREGGVSVQHRRRSISRRTSRRLISTADFASVSLVDPALAARPLTRAAHVPLADARSGRARRSACTTSIHRARVTSKFSDVSTVRAHVVKLNDARI